MHGLALPLLREVLPVVARLVFRLSESTGILSRAPVLTPRDAITPARYVAFIRVSFVAVRGNAYVAVKTVAMDAIVLGFVMAPIACVKFLLD